MLPGFCGDLRGHHVGSALISQLGTNLLGLGIPRLQTEVPWDNIDLISFFHHEGFHPAERLCLDLDLVRVSASALWQLPIEARAEVLVLAIKALRRFPVVNAAAKPSRPSIGQGWLVVCASIDTPAANNC